jgi:hypothetical protein
VLSSIHGSVKGCQLAAVAPAVVLLSEPVATLLLSAQLGKGMSVGLCDSPVVVVIAVLSAAAARTSRAHACCKVAKCANSFNVNVHVSSGHCQRRVHCPSCSHMCVMACVIITHRSIPTECAGCVHSANAASSMRRTQYNSTVRTTV